MKKIALSSRAKGYHGEALARGFLETRGCVILESNYYSPYGEIDIIVLEDSALAFCEVKAWRAFSAEFLGQVLDSRKKKRLVQTAEHYVFQNPQWEKNSWRFHLIYIDKEERLHFYPNAFQGDE